MRDAIERIRRDGYSTVLKELATRIPHISTNIMPIVSQPDIPIVIPNATVTNAHDWESLSAQVKTITVNGCDDYQKEVLDLSRFSELEELKIGAKCFNYVSHVRIVGLKRLRSIEIGENGFQNESSDSELVIQNCPSLVSLSINRNSFKGFRAMKLSELNALKTIGIRYHCFRKADLVVKDMRSLESISIGDGCFEDSRHTVIESGVVFICSSNRLSQTGESECW